MSTLEKTLPQLLAKLSRLENRGIHNASLALSANIGRVRELIAQARSAANKVGTHLRDISSGPGKLGSNFSYTTLSQVKVSMKFSGRSGVRLRTPRDLADLAAYTALKFYIQSPVPAPAPGENTGDRFVLYMGSRQVPCRRGTGHTGLQVRNGSLWSPS